MESMMLSDRQLLANLRSGDSQAFERIYNRYRDDLFALSVSLIPDLHTAEDIVHDVFLSFYRNAHRLRVEGSLPGYLSAGIRNAIRDIFRRRNRMDARGYLDQSRPLQRPPEETLSLHEFGQQLHRNLAHLPHAQRDVVVWRAYQDMPFTEIACRQHTCASTVRGRYRYGLKRLGTLMRHTV